MRYLLLLLILAWVSKLQGVEQVPVLTHLKLVGLIFNQIKPLESSILVIRDQRLQRSYTIQGRQPIPETSYRLSQFGRNFILVTDGNKVFQINRMEQNQFKESVSESNTLDELESDAIIARSKLVWERLEGKAEEKGMTLFKPDALGQNTDAKEHCYSDDCDTNEAGDTSPDSNTESSEEIEQDNDIIEEY